MRDLRVATAVLGGDRMLDGVDVLSGIEYLRFSDGLIAAPSATARAGYIKSFVTESRGSNLFDYALDYPGLTLQSETIEFFGSVGVDQIVVRPGVSIDFSFSGASQDIVFLEGNFADYTRKIAGTTVTLERIGGSTPEKVTLNAGGDLVVFADQRVDSNILKAGGPWPNPPLAPLAIPTGPFDASAKAFALYSEGDTFPPAEPGIHFTAVGGVGVDKVYVTDGTTVDATLLGASSDEIYFRGPWGDYAKQVAGTTLVFSRQINGVQETVTVAAGAGALDDTLIFANGSVTSLKALQALASNPNAAIDQIPGYDSGRTTPGLFPTLRASLLDEVNNLDPSSNIVLNFNVPVVASPNKYIRIVNDGGAVTVSDGTKVGFRGEDVVNTLVIEANDTSQVSVNGTTITINPKGDLDLANRYHIEIDAGAFTGLAGGLPMAVFNGSTVLNFTTVTPGRFDLNAASPSQKMSAQGGLLESFSWIDIEGIGSQPSDRRVFELNTGSYALAFKDYSSRPAGSPTGYDGIDAPGFFVAAKSFGSDDRIYIDNQSAEPNDLMRTIFVHNGTSPTTIQFAPKSGSLPGFVEISLVGSSSAFDGLTDWGQKLGGGVVPMISG